MRTKTEVVKIADLKKNLFVRTALNHDHAVMLGILMENGVALPPIKITRDRAVIDGRHRIEAHELNNLDAIEAEIVEVGDENELIGEAYRANTGGSLPPTKQDTEHTVMLLLDRNESKKRISGLLGLPAGMARRFISEVQSKLARAKLQRAHAAVTEGGLSVPKAAEQYGVAEEKLREACGGGRRRLTRGVVEMRRTLTTMYKGVSQRNAAFLRSLLDKYEDGDVQEKQALEAFEHLENLQKGSARAVADWKKRFLAVAASGKAELAKTT